MASIITAVLKAYRDQLKLDQEVLLAGHLHHRHRAARMDAAYAVTTSGHYGYAFSENAQISVPEIGIRAAEFLNRCNDVSLRLAVLDSIWHNTLAKHQRIQLKGKNLHERDRERSLLIARTIEAQACAAGIRPAVFMIGYFEQLHQILEDQMGFDVFYRDDGRGVDRSPIGSIDDMVFVSTSSYLVRDDFPEIQAMAKRAAFSLLIAQTASRMIQLHHDAGFDTVVSESFPTFSLAQSTLAIYEAVNDEPYPCQATCRETAALGVAAS